MEALGVDFEIQSQFVMAPYFPDTFHVCTKVNERPEFPKKHSTSHLVVLTIGYWTLDTGHWTLDTGYWILDIADRQLRRPRLDVQQLPGTGHVYNFGATSSALGFFHVPPLLLMPTGNWTATGQPMFQGDDTALSGKVASCKPSRQLGERYAGTYVKLQLPNGNSRIDERLLQEIIQPVHLDFADRHLWRLTRNKVGRVCFVRQRRLPRSRDALLQIVVGIDHLEEVVTDDVALDQVARVRAEAGAVRREAPHNALHDAHLVVALAVGKRAVARDHLVKQNTERPPIHGLAVAIAKDDLWRDVLGSATQRESEVLRHPLREAHIHQLRVAEAVDHDVLGLQVPVHDVVIVEVGNRQQDAEPVEARVVLGDPIQDAIATMLRFSSVLMYHMEQLAAGNKLQQEVDVGGVSEGLQASGDERVVAGLMNFLLLQGAAALVLLLQLLLGDGLQGVDALLAHACSHEIHFAEGAAAEGIESLQALETDVGALRRLGLPRHVGAAIAIVGLVVLAVLLDAAYRVEVLLAKHEAFAVRQGRDGGVPHGRTLRQGRGTEDVADADLRHDLLGCHIGVEARLLCGAGDEHVQRLCQIPLLVDGLVGRDVHALEASHKPRALQRREAAEEFARVQCALKQAGADDVLQRPEAQHLEEVFPADGHDRRGLHGGDGGAAQLSGE
eukprot:scaffold2469_cov239-Pinguiococcus_pyrenoidosus.AAC.2